MPTPYRARDVWNYTKEMIWRFNDISTVSVQFDDETVVESNGRALIFSWYLGVFHRQYPETPLLPHHHIGRQAIKKGIELKVLEKGLFDCIHQYGSRVDQEILAQLAFEAQNALYNDMSSGLKRYVSSTSILDFLDIMDHPNVYQANALIQQQPTDIDGCYETIWAALMNDPMFENNNVARVTKAKLINKYQLLQCIGPRGMITDIDSTLIRKPLTTGFVQGHRQLIDGLAESRAAAKSLILSSDSIADSEFFSRELQFVCSTIARIHPTDCGSTQTVPFIVHQEDLPHIAGKYYRLEDGSLAIVQEDDHTLIGKTLQLRSPLKCQHSDRYGVCETCFGLLAKSIPHDTNIGFLAAIVLCEQISQNLLSSKHLQTSCDITAFTVLDEDKPYIESITLSKKRRATDEEEDEDDVYTDDRVSVIRWKSSIQHQSPMLRLNPDQTYNLSEVDYNPIDKLTPSMITRLDYVGLTIKDARSGLNKTVNINVSNGNRYSWLTSEALAYIKKKGWVLTDQNESLIDLSDWDFDQPFFQLPMKHASAVEYMKTVKAFIKNSSKTRNQYIKTLSGYNTVERAVIELYELINSLLDVNLVYLEIITLAMMAESPENQDYRPPRPIESGRIVNYSTLMNNRSLSVIMAYKDQKKKLTHYKSYLVKDRADSIFDNLLEPMINNPKN